jgi:hypothetical protein
MRILHIDTGREMRGGQWQVLHLLQGLSERGIAARLLARKNSALFQAATSLSLDVRPLRTFPPVFDSRGFDLVHAHDARAHTLAMFCRKPLVVSRRVAFAIQESPFSHWKYERATHFLAVSKHVRQVLAASGVPLEKISVVYDGVRVPERNPSENRDLVLALDSDDPGKGKAIVEKAAEIAGVPVHFSKQLMRDLPQASLFLYITNLEGLGSAALLAMANGAPVIASRVGGLPEIVDHGTTGLLTDNGPAAVACAIGRMLEDRALSNRMAFRARKQVERHFTVDHMVEQTLRAYEKVLA